MLAYAASRPVSGKRQSSPNAMLLVISAHVALVAVVMSAKMDLPPRVIPEPPIKMIKFRIDPPPAPIRTARPQQRPDPISSWIDRTQPQVQTPTLDGQRTDTGQAAVMTGGFAGAGAATIPEIPHAVITSVRHGPQLLTPPSQLKPPYPASKLLSEEEATLTLRLSIDDSGRVVAVDPIGSADRAFLEAARRHVLAHWRYRPATDDGRAISSSVTVTLRFMLDG